MRTVELIRGIDNMENFEELLDTYPEMAFCVISVLRKQEERIQEMIEGSRVETDFSGLSDLLNRRRKQIA